MQRKFKSPNSFRSKARTQLRNKQRRITEVVSPLNDYRGNYWIPNFVENFLLVVLKHLCALLLSIEWHLLIDKMSLNGSPLFHITVERSWWSSLEYELIPPILLFHPLTIGVSPLFYMVGRVFVWYNVPSYNSLQSQSPSLLRQNTWKCWAGPDVAKLDHGQKALWKFDNKSSFSFYLQLNFNIHFPLHS